MSLRWPFLCLQKNRTSPNFSQPELARVPNFSYLRESSQDIPRIMFKSYTSFYFISIYRIVGYIRVGDS